MYGPDAVCRLAVDAVRPIYRQALADVAYAQMSAHNLERVYKALLLEVGRDLDDERGRERLVELGTEAVAAQTERPAAAESFFAPQPSSRHEHCEATSGAD